MVVQQEKVDFSTQPGWIMQEKRYFVYMLSSKAYGTLYTGVTSNLVQRVYQHKEGLAEGFTKRYNVNRLVYYEIHSDVYEAITREKRIKKWNRQWKINLIELNNPQWLDLSIGLF
jgi:putative endonuclease